MSEQNYSGYTAYIYRGDDPSSAAAKGEYMKTQFPGADFEVMEGNPLGQCSNVDGSDPSICHQIREWINSAG